MRIPGAGRLAVLGLGVAVSLACAQSPAKFKAEPTESTSSWWQNWFGSKKEQPKPTEAIPVAPTVEDKHAKLERLMKAYLRRQEVCDRLRDIALQNNDDKLYEEANRLEELAWRLHQTKSSQILGTAMAATEDLPDAESESTLEVLKRAASTGKGSLPPRLDRSGMEPAAANRMERKRGEER